MAAACKERYTHALAAYREALTIAEEMRLLRNMLAEREAARAQRIAL